MKTIILPLASSIRKRVDVPDGTVCKVYFEWNMDTQVYEIALVFD